MFDGSVIHTVTDIYHEEQKVTKDSIIESSEYLVTLKYTRCAAIREIDFECSQIFLVGDRDNPFHEEFHFLHPMIVDAVVQQRNIKILGTSK